MRTTVDQTTGDRSRRRRRLRIALVASVAVVLAAAGSAAAFQALPPGGQVNDDLASGINPNLSVSGEDPTNADVVGGALTAGGKAVPWAVFRQTGGVRRAIRSSAVRSRMGAWKTRGIGTVGGRSSSAPTFNGSLNFDQGQDGEAPEIDFAGTGRTVPWATWYEDTTGTGFEQQQRLREPLRQHRGRKPEQVDLRRTGPGQRRQRSNVPSLNIHTDQDAENPSVAGGSALDATKPGPWITWQETAERRPARTRSSSAGRIGPGATNCDGVDPGRRADGTGHVPAIGGFCFQQTGVRALRVRSADPSLNVDPTRDGVEPDIAFTGAGSGLGALGGLVREGRHRQRRSAPLHDNEMVFAAKAVADWGRRRRQLQLGRGRQQRPGRARRHRHRPLWRLRCDRHQRGGVLPEREPGADAEDPRVAAGTMNPANATVPWVAWDENVGTASSSLRLAARRRHAVRARQQRPADLGRRRRLDPPRHHVLGQHART